MSGRKDLEDSYSERSVVALMFTGTMLHRAEQGQYSWRKAISIAVAVLGLAITAGV